MCRWEELSKKEGKGKCNKSLKRSGDLIATVRRITLVNLIIWIDRIGWKKVGQEANPCCLEGFAHGICIH